MSHPDDRRPDGSRDRELSRLISDAVTDVEPGDRLHQLQTRTAARRRRHRLLATGGAVVAAAAVVTAVALAGGNPVPSTDPGPAASSATPASPDPTGTPPSPSSTPETGGAVAVYYLGDTPRGVRLYREFRTHTDPLAGALELIALPPVDRDYWTAWQPGQLLRAGFDGVGDTGEISVEVDPGVSARPEGMDEEEARAAVQQVVYTLQAAVQARAPVRFLAGGEPVEQVFGVATAQPVTNAAALETLALVNLTTPEEGATVSSGTLPVEGVASSFEANVPWSLLRDGEVVANDSFTAQGWMGDRLFPFSGEIDVSSLDPGSYTLKVETDDPTGGAEGPGATADTRTVVIE